MQWNPNLTQLRNMLADLYPTVDDARRVVEDAGLQPNYIAFDNKAVNNWHHILTEAMRREKVAAIIQVVQQEYGEQAAWLQASQAYLAANPPMSQPQLAGSPAATAKYDIHIANAQEVVIGDNAQITQNPGGTHIATQGGAYIAGDVTTGGDFVGRDHK